MTEPTREELIKACDECLAFVAQEKPSFRFQDMHDVATKLKSILTRPIDISVNGERQACAEIADRIATHYYAQHVDPETDPSDETAAYRACEEIRDAIRLRKSLITQPAGDYVLVPREPTEEMLTAGTLHDIDDANSDIGADVEGIYKAMLAASREGKS